MSRRTLYRKLAAVTGLSPNDIIKNYRLQRATQFLLAGHSISETSYLVGFENPSTFGQIFKKQYQKSPSEYYQQHMAQSKE
ncbi:MAG: helix-turn-helix domain-containing protein [Bacteroidota bacterium]|nr:helix-turn-helix domain-containing protein [Bacteroidota bacterium]